MLYQNEKKKTDDEPKYTFKTKSELVIAVNMWDNDKENAISIYGEINMWDVSLITDMTGLFAQLDFNDDISNWDVSNVTNMGFMFDNATAFNQDIGSWDTSSVTNMDYMFIDATAFNQNIRRWSVSDTTLLTDMFSGATAMIAMYTGTPGFGTTPTSDFFNQ